MMLLPHQHMPTGTLRIHPSHRVSSHSHDRGFDGHADTPQHAHRKEATRQYHSVAMWERERSQVIPRTHTTSHSPSSLLCHCAAAWLTRLKMSALPFIDCEVGHRKGHG
jgi:hypothetical protein